MRAWIDIYDFYDEQFVHKNVKKQNFTKLNITTDYVLIHLCMQVSIWMIDIQFITRKKTYV